MGGLRVIFSNYLINVGLVAWFSAQILKVIITYFTTNKVNWERFVGAGGMPSSHSALVCSITIAMAKKVGFSSPEFALSLTLAAIVMYDAMGVRRAAGEQAKVLNNLLEKGDLQTWMRKILKQGVEEDLPEKEEISKEEADSPKLLKEFLGHTPLEVLGGALLGILVAMAMPVI